MPDMIAIKIDLNKIMDEHLFNSEKSGAQYLDAVLIPSKDSKYGDSHFITQSVSKAAREAGQRGPIIGNAKLLGVKKTGGAAPAAPPYVPKVNPRPTPPKDETLPF